VRVLRTKRLRLEPVTPANAEVLWEVLQEPGLRDYQDLPDLDLTGFLRSVAARPPVLKAGAAGRFEWLVYDGEGTSAIGWVSLRIAERARTTAEIGYSIVSDRRGQGLATEAASALIEEGFRSADLRRIRAYCVPENASSRAVLRHMAFEDDGVLPHGATVQGQPVDVIAFTLERDRWMKAATPNPEATRS